MLFLCSWLNGYSTAIIFWQYFRPYLAVNPFHPVVFYFSGASNKSKPAWIPDERQIRNSSSLEVIARRWWMFIRNPFPRLATDLNVILLSHQGTESRPWVAKGYSVANEVCTGPPWVMAVTHQSVQTPPGQRYRTAQASVVRWHSADAETMKHIDQKNPSIRRSFWSLPLQMAPFFNTHFLPSSEEVSLRTCPLWSESVNYDSSKCLRLPRKAPWLFIATIIINMRQSMLPEKIRFFFYSLYTKFGRSKLHIQPVFACV